MQLPPRFLLSPCSIHLEDAASTQVIAEFTGKFTAEFAAKFWVELQTSQQARQAQALQVAI
ncbi:hypothetical protein E2320_016278, partial [Naja naja]